MVFLGNFFFLLFLKYNYYNQIGIDAIYNTEIEKLNTLISKKTVVLTGQSGAGKSSLLNRLNPD